MRIDLRGPAPYYTLTKDADRIVQNRVGWSIPKDSAQIGPPESDTHRDDFTAPQTFQKTVPVDYSTREFWLFEAARETEPHRKADLFKVAGLEDAFARASAAAQQIVQDAVNAGVDWLYGDAKYLRARMERGFAMNLAVSTYNSGLPLAFGYLRKSASGWGY
jgi:hypothetical protein